MSFTNVLANAFSVPLILEENAKREAIAAAILSQASPTDDKKPRLVARSVVDQFIDLGEAHDLDGILGGHADDREDFIADLGSEMGEPSDLRKALARRLIERLVQHLHDDSRDVGNVSGSNYARRSPAGSRRAGR